MISKVIDKNITKMKINLSKIALLILLVLTCTKKKPMFKEPVARLTIQSIEQLSVKLFKAITQNNCEEVQSILCSVQVSLKPTRLSTVVGTSAVTMTRALFLALPNAAAKLSRGLFLPVAQNTSCPLC